MSVHQPQMQTRYVDPDGRLTVEGMQLLLAMAQQIDANTTAIATNTTAIADHEARITTLEP